VHSFLKNPRIYKEDFAIITKTGEFRMGINGTLDRIEIAGRPYITKQGFASQLGVSVDTLDRWQRQGRLPPRIRIGTKQLYAEDRLNAWMASRES
jgi:hypothetical protein